MEKQPQIWTLGELAKILEAELVGPADFVIDAPATSASNNPRGLAFAESKQYVAEAIASPVGAVIVPPGTVGVGKPHLIHPAPRAAFGKFLHLANQPYVRQAGIHPTAIIDPTAEIDPSASIGAYCVIEQFSKIGPQVNVMPFCYIGEECEIGENSTLLPRVTMIRKVTIGKNCEIGPGAVLGHAGFGYYWNGSEQIHVPQVGGVVIGDKVDIGALAAIDRATADNTVIEDGNKFDNLIQVGHNVKIGKHGVFASQVGIAGSTTIGARMMAGGQSGFADHVTVCDDVIISGRAGVMGTLDEPGMYGGAPCIPILQFHRAGKVMNDLPNMAKRLKALEKKVAELEGQ